MNDLEGLAWVLPACGGLVALAAGVTVVVRVVRWVTTWSHRWGNFLEDWQGEPARPGHERRPGVLERLLLIEKRVGRIEAQVTPNGGSSMADGLARIETKLDESAG
jgi:hypothetical protein